MSTSDMLSIGLSGALTAKRALGTAGHNIANANTEGFSRQRVDVDTRPPQLAGIGSIGTGVQVNNIKRVHDEFVSSEMRSNASIYNSLQMNYDFTSQVDNMLADPDAGLAPSMQQFFSAVNSVANDPSSQSSRQVLLGQASALGERFSYLDNRFESLRKGTNETLKSEVKDVNDLAKAIADVNWKIVISKEVVQGEPSDLLDQRERLLHRLSNKITVQTNEQENGALNVFIGNGQTLVVGKRYSELDLKANDHDPSELEVVFKNQNSDSIVTQFLKGGSIGGLLDFRKNILGAAQNELGRIAIGVTKTFNDQHRKGMTLENNLGGDFFSAIDKTTPLSLPSTTNTGDYELKTTISNVDKLSTSDYVLNYNAGTYTLIRNEDEKVVGNFNSLPQKLESEGFSIELARGTKIETGDSFLIRPTRMAARKFSLDVKRTNDIAAAAPVRIRTSVHNMGDVNTQLTSVTDIKTPSFTTMNKTLSPTITIRFIDENNIELLDDSGKAIKAQQLDAQNKSIPATTGVAGDNGSPATNAISSQSTSKPEDEAEGGNTSGPTLETAIKYDPNVGISLFPTPGGLETGYAIQLSGKAKAGDVFVVEYNHDAFGDNVNALELSQLQSKATLDNGTSNYTEIYSQLVTRVGSKTHELDVNREAQNILYNQTKAQREVVSGVNLDEEAADLVRYQQSYQANAQVIGAAHEMFNTLIGVLNR